VSPASTLRRFALRLILIGCEYVGTTALGDAIKEWFKEAMGAETGFHEHWKIPHVAHSELTEEEQQQYLALSPRLKELMQRNNLEYHVQPSFYNDSDHCMVGHYIEEKIYGPMYFGYGGPDDDQNRAIVARHLERSILELGPDTVIVHLKASPEVIRERMKANPHESQVIKEEDVELVLQRFQEEYDDAVFFSRMELDTTTATVEETLAEWVEQMEPFWSDADRIRMLMRRS
jgi:hypothetical protein